MGVLLSNWFTQRNLKKKKKEEKKMSYLRIQNNPKLGIKGTKYSACAVYSCFLRAGWKHR